MDTLKRRTAVALLAVGLLAAGAASLGAGDTEGGGGRSEDGVTQSGRAEATREALPQAVDGTPSGADATQTAAPRAFSPERPDTALKRIRTRPLSAAANIPLPQDI